MILDEIAAKRQVQLEREKAAVPPAEIERRARQAPSPKDFRAALLQGKPSVIAEVKKASPSRGVIAETFRPVETARAYEAAGADALSVLTEEAYFQGASAYLAQIRAAVSLPILRKDFIFDPYQIYEARALGADAVLLIAALLDENALRAFLALARSLGLACLTEAHSETELSRAAAAGADIVGINNRDLRTFHVDLSTTERLAAKVPEGCVLVSESGVASPGDVRLLRRAGADAVLIGETLMRSGNVSAALKELRGT